MLTISTSSPASQPLQASIPLGFILTATVDYDDFAALNKYHWSARKSHSCWYATRKTNINGKRRTVFMHRQIVGPTPDQAVHHINRNTLDNRRSNLIAVTPQAHAFLQAELHLAHNSPDHYSYAAAWLRAHGVISPCCRPYARP